MNNQEDLVYTLVINRWHDNVAFMFNESNRLNPKKDEIDFIEGFVGSYPNYLFVVEQDDFNDFLDMLKNFESNHKYYKKIFKYGLNRADENFWENYDWFQNKFYESDELNAGLFDLNRYYNETFTKKDLLKISE